MRPSIDVGTYKILRNSDWLWCPGCGKLRAMFRCCGRDTMAFEILHTAINRGEIHLRILAETGLMKVEEDCIDR